MLAAYVRDGVGGRAGCTVSAAVELWLPTSSKHQADVRTTKINLNGASNSLFKKRL